MNTMQRLVLCLLTMAGLGLPVCPAMASGSEPASMPIARDAPGEQVSERKRSPRQQAEAAYREGFGQIKKADRFAQDAAQASDADKKFRAEEKSRGFYQLALEKFQSATQLDPKMHEAWNYVGYSQRHLGHYAEALEAYARALELKPDYAEAVEYRGEAYLGLGRLEEARAAYLDLFAKARPLADQLLTAMQSFVAARRESPKGLDAQALDDFAKWVQERAQIAQQTASLSPGSPAPVWH